MIKTQVGYRMEPPGPGGDPQRQRQAVQALCAAVRRAVADFATAGYRLKQQRCMALDVSWDKPAQQWEQVPALRPGYHIAGEWCALACLCGCHITHEAHSPPFCRPFWSWSMRRLENRGARLADWRWGCNSDNMMPVPRSCDRNTLMFLIVRVRM